MNIGEQPEGYIDEIVVLTNGDSVRMYKDDRLIGEYFPDTSYKNLAHPPVVITDYVGEQLETVEGFDKRTSAFLKECLLWKQSNPQKPFPIKIQIKCTLFKCFKGIGQEKIEELFEKYVSDWKNETTAWRFEAVRENKVMKTVTISPVEKLHLEIKADMQLFKENDICQMYEEETWDMVTLRLRALDQNGNLAPYCNDVLHFQTEGSIRLNGPSSIAMEGGMAGCYVCTDGTEGEGKLHIYRGDQKVETRTFQIKVYRSETEKKYGEGGEK